MTRYARPEELDRVRILYDPGMIGLSPDGCPDRPWQLDAYVSTSRRPGDLVPLLVSEETHNFPTWREAMDYVPTFIAEQQEMPR